MKLCCVVSYYYNATELGHLEGDTHRDSLEHFSPGFICRIPLGLHSAPPHLGVNPCQIFPYKSTDKQVQLKKCSCCVGQCVLEITCKEETPIYHLMGMYVVHVSCKL